MAGNSKLFRLRLSMCYISFCEFISKRVLLHQGKLENAAPSATSSAGAEGAGGLGSAATARPEWRKGEAITILGSTNTNMPRDDCHFSLDFKQEYTGFWHHHLNFINFFSRHFILLSTCCTDSACNTFEADCIRRATHHT